MELLLTFAFGFVTCAAVERLGREGENARKLDSLRTLHLETTAKLDEAVNENAALRQELEVRRTRGPRTHS